jgi:hypothetical protein
MGATGVSKSQVSLLCVELDAEVQAFLTRQLEGLWPYLWLDATYLKWRMAGRITSLPTIAAVAVHIDGWRPPRSADRVSSRDRIEGLLAFAGDERRHRSLRGGGVLDRVPALARRPRSVRRPAGGHRRSQGSQGAPRGALSTPASSAAACIGPGTSWPNAGPKQRAAVAAMIKTIFVQSIEEEAYAQWNKVADALQEKHPSRLRANARLIADDERPGHPALSAGLTPSSR